MGPIRYDIYGKRSNPPPCERTTILTALIEASFRGLLSFLPSVWSFGGANGRRWTPRACHMLTRCQTNNTAPLSNHNHPAQIETLVPLKTAKTCAVKSRRLTSIVMAMEVEIDNGMVPSAHSLNTESINYFDRLPTELLLEVLTSF